MVRQHRLEPWRGRRRRAGALLAFAAMLSAGPTPPASATIASCRPVSAGGPVFVTETCVDPALNQPYIDIDKPGTTTDPATKATVSYRYVHGGFTGTSARFSLYFPAAARYRARFFESTYPTISREDAAPDTIAFAISNGAYVVSTNNGGGVAASGALGGYRINAAAAKYSRIVAARVYGNAARPRGYIYGASGGAYQTLGALENTSGVWDGGVPMVPGVPDAIPSFATVELLALRVLKDKLPQIADAMAPGGSGDPYAGLNTEQQNVLREATRLGFPLRGWWQYATLDGGSFFATQGGVRALDPTYVSDFWTKPGYAGADTSAQAARILHAATVTATSANGLTLSSVPPGDLTGADLVVTSGAAAGTSVPLGTVTGNTVGFGSGTDPAVTAAIKPGDQIRIDNSWFIALQYYQRYQVPAPEQYGWNQYRGPDGTPIYPQRPLLAGPILAAGAGGAAPTGNFHGKMIMLASVMDVQAYPWSADWYRKQAWRRTSDFRLWYMDNADHDPAGPAATTAAKAPDHIVSYAGELQQALLDLDAWVTSGVRPPAGTGYTVDTNDQIRLAPAANRRSGVQPAVVLSAKASGAPRFHRIDVAAGTRVAFTARAQVPPGAGTIVHIEWDLQGTGAFTTTPPTRHPRPSATLTATYTFTRPGTYFPVVRVTSQRDGDTTAPYGLIQNLAAIRVVVH